MKLLAFLKNAIFFILIPTFSFAASVPPAESTPPPRVVGHVIWMKGTFKAQLPNAEPRILKRNSEVYEHDTLTTEANSSGKIVFRDTDVLTMSENSTMKIDQYHHKTHSSFANNPIVIAVQKFIRSILRAITSTLTENAPGGYVPKSS